MQAVVLAGGLGTRLRSVVADVPKPMAPVANRPFLDYILHYLKAQGVTRVVLAVGYKWEVIRDRYAQPENAFGLEIAYSVETEPLGTGGAIFQAAAEVTADEFFIINGDTSFQVPLAELKSLATAKDAEMAIALKPIDNPDRYGTVETDADGRIQRFIEKGASEVTAPYQINGGIYLMKKELTTRFDLPQKFSFEVDFMQQYLETVKVYGAAFDVPFIDIGIPDDFHRAQQIFANALD